MPLTNGKKSDMTGDIMLVVAGALIDQDGRWLMHRRPFEKHHGGLWEFPGGKVESGETPVIALFRELHEELGIEIVSESCEPAGFADGAASATGMPIVILLYKVGRWAGDPVALEGEAIGWFHPEEATRLEKPPLDEILVRQLLDCG